jgi:hypothetical protein
VYAVLLATAAAARPGVDAMRAGHAFEHGARRGIFSGVASINHICKLNKTSRWKNTLVGVFLRSVRFWITARDPLQNGFLHRDRHKFKILLIGYDESLAGIGRFETHSCNPQHATDSKGGLWRLTLTRQRQPPSDCVVRPRSIFVTKSESIFEFQPGYMHSKTGSLLGRPAMPRAWRVRRAGLHACAELRGSARKKRTR